MVKIERLGGPGDTCGNVQIFGGQFYSAGKWIVGPWVALVAIAPLFQWGINRFAVLGFLALVISGSGLIFYLMRSEMRSLSILKGQRTAYTRLAIPLLIVGNLYLFMPDVTRMLESYLLVNLKADSAEVSEWIRGFEWLWVGFLAFVIFVAVVQFINMHNVLKARKEIGPFDCNFDVGEESQRVINAKFDDSRNVEASGFTYITFYPQKLLLMAFGLMLFALQSVAATMGDVNMFLLVCIATITQQELFKNALVVEFNGAIYREMSVCRTIFTQLLYCAEPQADDGSDGEDGDKLAK